jgi:hypothetical protein
VEEVKFIDEIVFPEISYMAMFDPMSGAVLSVGPSTAFGNNKNVIKIDSDTAEMIINGEINVFNCAVDVRSLTFELIEKKTISLIDDVLHRIIDKKWSTIDNPDIHLTVNVRVNKIVVQLTEEFHGTYKLPDKYQPLIKRNIIWDGDTILNFYITEYNDPNILYDRFSILLKDLVDNKITVKCKNLPKKFSIYTRRVFKNYVLEIK